MYSYSVYSSSSGGDEDFLLGGEHSYSRVYGNYRREEDASYAEPFAYGDSWDAATFSVESTAMFKGDISADVRDYCQEGRQPELPCPSTTGKLSPQPDTSLSAPAYACADDGTVADSLSPPPAEANAQQSADVEVQPEESSPISFPSHVSPHLEPAGEACESGLATTPYTEAYTPDMHHSYAMADGICAPESGREGCESPRPVASSPESSATRPGPATGVAERNWNEEFQRIMSGKFSLGRDVVRSKPTERLLSTKDVENRIHKLKALYDLVTEFAAVARSKVITIIKELHMSPSNKTIPQAAMGGIAGGNKFVSEGIFFKLAVDSANIYGGDEFAMKAASHELAGLRAFSMLASSEIRMPLMVLVSYMGWRVYATAMLPLSSDSLVYGSQDAGKTVRNSEPDFSAWMLARGQTLNLKPHVVGNALSQTIVGPADIEGHAGTDGRYYLLDTARVFPAETPIRNLSCVFIPMDEKCIMHNLQLTATEAKILASDSAGRFSMSPFEGGFVLHSPLDDEAGVALTDSETRVNNLASLLLGKPVMGNALVWRAAPKGVHLVNLLRPELVKNNSVPLSSDVFCRFGRHNAAVHNREAFECTKRLRTRVIPSFVEDIVFGKWFARTGEEVVRLMHDRGINCRYLGLVRYHVMRNISRAPRPLHGLVCGVADLLLEEMVVRVMVNSLRQRLRSVVQQNGGSAADNARVALSYFHEVLDCKDEKLQHTILRALLTWKYGAYLEGAEGRYDALAVERAALAGLPKASVREGFERAIKVFDAQLVTADMSRDDMFFSGENAQTVSLPLNSLYLLTEVSKRVGFRLKPESVLRLRRNPALILLIRSQLTLDDVASPPFRPREKRIIEDHDIFSAVQRLGGSVLQPFFLGNDDPQTVSTSSPSSSDVSSDSEQSCKDMLQLERIAEKMCLGKVSEMGILTKYSALKSQLAAKIGKWKSSLDSKIRDTPFVLGMLSDDDELVMRLQEALDAHSERVSFVFGVDSAFRHAVNISRAVLYARRGYLAKAAVVLAGILDYFDHTLGLFQIRAGICSLIGDVLHALSEPDLGLKFWTCAISDLGVRQWSREQIDAASTVSVSRLSRSGYDATDPVPWKVYLRDKVQEIVEDKEGSVSSETLVDALFKISKLDSTKNTMEIFRSHLPVSALLEDDVVANIINGHPLDGCANLHLLRSKGGTKDLPVFRHFLWAKQASVIYDKTMASGAAALDQSDEGVDLQRSHVRKRCAAQMRNRRDRFRALLHYLLDQSFNVCRSAPMRKDLLHPYLFVLLSKTVMSEIVHHDTRIGELVNLCKCHITAKDTWLMPFDPELCTRYFGSRVPPLFQVLHHQNRGAYIARADNLEAKHARESITAALKPLEALEGIPPQMKSQMIGQVKAALAAEFITPVESSFDNGCRDRWTAVMDAHPDAISWWTSILGRYANFSLGILELIPRDSQYDIAHATSDVDYNSKVSLDETESVVSLAASLIDDNQGITSGIGREVSVLSADVLDRIKFPGQTECVHCVKTSCPHTGGWVAAFPVGTRWKLRMTMHSPLHPENVISEFVQNFTLKSVLDSYAGCSIYTDFQIPDDAMELQMPFLFGPLFTDSGDDKVIEFKGLTFRCRRRVLQHTQLGTRTDYEAYICPDTHMMLEYSNKMMVGDTLCGEGSFKATDYFPTMEVEGVVYEHVIEYKGTQVCGLAESVLTSYRTLPWLPHAVPTDAIKTINISIVDGGSTSSIAETTLVKIIRPHSSVV